MKSHSDDKSHHPLRSFSHPLGRFSYLLGVFFDIFGGLMLHNRWEGGGYMYVGEQASSVAKKRRRKQTANKNKQTKVTKRQARQHTLTTTISFTEITYRVKIS